MDRRTALWSAGACTGEIQDVLPGLDDLAPAPELPVMTAAEAAAADLDASGAGATTHPAQHLRALPASHGAQPAREARDLADQTRVRVGGLAKYIQRPPTAKGVALRSTSSLRKSSPGAGPASDMRHQRAETGRQVT